MERQLQSRGRLKFGPFEVDVAARALRKRGIPIKLSGQPFQILLALVAEPGKLVTREQLRDSLWDEGVFVDFEGSLNSAVTKLRRALTDSVDSPRYVETVPGVGYRFIGNLEREAEIEPAPTTAPVIQETQLKRWCVPHWFWLAAGVACLVSFFTGLRFHGAPNSPRGWKVTRLTADSGLSNTPVISADGKLLAYSSDRSESGGRDLYVKQVAGGDPIRLTFDGAGNTTPDFSPDGSKIVFRSSRDGSGIYETATFGGEVRLLAQSGLNPKYSPDGSRVAFWVGAENTGAAVPGSGTVWVVSASGGQPFQVGKNFTTARYPIWSPDSKHLLLVGYTSAEAYQSSSIDWWLVAMNGEGAVKTGAYDLLHRAGILMRESDGNMQPGPVNNFPTPRCWLPAENEVIFSVPNGHASNVWGTRISPESGKVTGAPNVITMGADNESDSSCAGDDFVFANIEVKRSVWSLAFDLNRGISKGTLTRTSQTSAAHESPSLSRDGRYIAFSSNESGRYNVWRLNLATGNESHVASSSDFQRYPAITASGSRIAFSVYEKTGKRSVYVSDSGGLPAKVCDGCLRATDWSRDDQKVLVFGGSPYKISLLDVVSHRQTEILKHSTHPLLYARFSPDNQWISFTERTDPARAKIMIAPFYGPKVVPEKEWIEIAEERTEDWANWSPDGKTLYFTSARDGHFCIWGQRIDAHSHQPAGDTFAVQHFHGHLSYQQNGWSAAGGRIAIVLREDIGNIWMMSRSNHTPPSKIAAEQTNSN